MKHLIAVIILCFTASHSMAQTQTLLSNDIKHGGYGGPVLKVTQINNETGVMVGGQGGWIINDTFCMGAGGYGLATIHEAPDAAIHHPAYLKSDGSPRDLELALGYGGLLLEYFNNYDNLVHFTIDTLIGAGGIVYTENIEYDDAWDKNDAFFVLEPGFSAEMNITEWFKIAAGVSYIYVKGIDENIIVGMENSDFGGLTGNLLFKFGSF